MVAAVAQPDWRSPYVHLWLHRTERQPRLGRPPPHPEKRRYKKTHALYAFTESRRYFEHKQGQSRKTDTHHKLWKSLSARHVTSADLNRLTDEYVIASRESRES